VGGFFSCWQLRRKTRGRLAAGIADTKVLHQFCETLPLSLVGFAVSAAFVSFGYLDPIYILTALVVGAMGSYRARPRRESARGVTLRGFVERTSVRRSPPTLSHP